MDVKDRILQKANDLFLRFGIRSITMDEIAGQLGISKKTIYQFFTDKDEMVAGVVDAHILENEQRCVHFVKDSADAIQEIFMAIEQAEEMMAAMNPLIMYDLEKYHPKSHKKLRDHINRFLYEKAKDNILRGMKEGLFRENVRVDIACHHRIESVFMCFNQDVFPQSRFRISEVSRELTLLYLYSIATEKGRTLIKKYSTERIKHLSHEQ